jgi:hypothetical protein
MLTNEAATVAYYCNTGYSKTAKGQFTDFSLQLIASIAVCQGESIVPAHRADYIRRSFGNSGNYAPFLFFC